MATLTRTTDAQQRAHSFGNAPLAANDLAEVIGRDMQFQNQGITVVAHLAYLHGVRTIDQRLCHVLNKFTHGVYSLLIFVHASVCGVEGDFICSKRAAMPERLSRDATESVGCAPFLSQPSALSSSI